MIFKCKKINGVGKNICTCEQKIAYNYAFMYHSELKEVYNSNNTNLVKAQAYQKIIDFVVDGIERNGINKKYNIDAIINCFRNGIKRYMIFNNSGILTSYEDIGSIFYFSYDII